MASIKISNTAVETNLKNVLGLVGYRTNPNTQDLETVQITGDYNNQGLVSIAPLTIYNDPTEIDPNPADTVDRVVFSNTGVSGYGDIEFLSTENIKIEGGANNPSQTGQVTIKSGGVQSVKVEAGGIFDVDTGGKISLHASTGTSEFYSKTVAGISQANLKIYTISSATNKGHIEILSGGSNVDSKGIVLKSATEINVDLHSLSGGSVNAPTVGDVLQAKDTDGNIKFGKIILSQDAQGNQNSGLKYSTTNNGLGIALEPNKGLSISASGLAIDFSNVTSTPQAPSIGAPFLNVITATSAEDARNAIGAAAAGGGDTSFTSLTPGDVVKWDYSVDGPNIELITTQDPDPAITRDNVITMWDDSTDTASSISSIPDGATGILIVHPTANPYFNFPTGSKISDGSNIRLDGSTKVLRWVKEGDGNDPTAALGSQGYGCLYWAGFENFTTPATILGPDIEPAIISNLYGWWDPNDYTGAVSGDQNDPATGSPYLGVVNNSTLTSKSLGGSSTGNSLTVDNEETQADEAWEHIEWVNLGSSNYSFDFKPTGSANFLFNNDTVNPANNRYTVMVWFRSDFSSDNSDLGLFNASITGSSSQLNLSSGIKADETNDAADRNISYTIRPSSFSNIKQYESKYQNWANNDWTCLIMAFDPVKDDGSGGTYAEIRHLMGNEYTEENAGDTITGSGIVSDSDEIDINANGTYIDFLYDDGDLSKPSDGSAAGVPASEKLVASEMIEQFTGFQFARTAGPYYSTHDWNGEIGLCCLWDGEAKSDADMQTIYDYSKSKFGL